MKRGEVYRCGEKVPERGYKPSFYVVVSRNFVARNDEITTVVCAPVYSRRLGIPTEVFVGPDDGLPQDSSIRGDFLTLLLKKKLTGFVATLPSSKLRELNRALRYALELD